MSMSCSGSSITATTIASMKPYKLKTTKRSMFIPGSDVLAISSIRKPLMMISLSLEVYRITKMISVTSVKACIMLISRTAVILL
jgi:hypothetical protein